MSPKTNRVLLILPLKENNSQVSVLGFLSRIRASGANRVTVFFGLGSVEVSDKAILLKKLLGNQIEFCLFYSVSVTNAIYFTKEMAKKFAITLARLIPKN